MNKNRRLNCYVFGNFIVSFLTLNVLVSPTSRVLVEKESNTSLNKIYEKEIMTISTPDTIISSEDNNNVVRISNNVSNNTTYNYDYVKPSYNSVTGTNLVNYARNFLGLRYVHAGNSLVTGTDCSGFTSLIYKEFGISLGRTVASQINSGSYVSKDDLQPGDLVFYSYGSVASHVAIYMGDGLIIHQSTPRDGVKISSVNIMRYITARRLITSNVVSQSQEVVPVVESKPEEVKVTEKVEEKNIDNSKTDQITIDVKETIKEETEIKDKDEIKSVEETSNVEETSKGEEKLKEVEKPQEETPKIKNIEVVQEEKIVENE